MCDPRWANAENVECFTGGDAQYAIEPSLHIDRDIEKPQTEGDIEIDQIGEAEHREAQDYGQVYTVVEKVYAGG